MHAFAPLPPQPGQPHQPGSPTAAPDADAAPAHGAALLSSLGVIQAHGADAARFLQAQLTQDVESQRPGEARLAAFCNAKGRMLASFIVCRRAADDFLLVCSRDLLAATLKRLSMFVLRAQLKLSDASERFALYGWLGVTPESIADYQAQTSAEGSFDAYFVAPLPPADATPRWLLIAPREASAPAVPALAESLWDAAAVRSGVATLSQPVLEAFVPQMLNYESVGGVNFKKGCYPGQEVVARSQFRGAIKRRACVGEVAGRAAAGDEVWDAAAPEQPVGLIAQAAPLASGHTAVIVSLQTAARDAASLHVGAADGPRLAALSLPYPLRDDI